MLSVWLDMKLKLSKFSVHGNDGHAANVVGATLEIVFSDKGIGTLGVAGDIGISFEHPNPTGLTFAEVERLAIDRVLESL